MRSALGQDGLDALAAAYPHIPASADYVMYWWDRAPARAAGRGARFGLITTNSITQTFNRRVTAAHLDPDPDDAATNPSSPQSGEVPNGRRGERQPHPLSPSPTPSPTTRGPTTEPTCAWPSP